MIEIMHGLFDVEFAKFHVRGGTDVFMLPTKFMELLFEKATKWHKKYNYKLIPYTIGFDVHWNIFAIAIVHPWDTFNKEVGESIIRGRLARQRGELAPQRWEYNRLINFEPPYMICHKINVGDKTIIQQEEL